MISQVYQPFKPDSLDSLLEMRQAISTKHCHIEWVLLIETTARNKVGSCWGQLVRWWQETSLTKISDSSKVFTGPQQATNQVWVAKVRAEAKLLRIPKLLIKRQIIIVLKNLKWRFFTNKEYSWCRNRTIVKLNSWSLRTKDLLNWSKFWRTLARSSNKKNSALSREWI